MAYHPRRDWILISLPLQLPIYKHLTLEWKMPGAITHIAVVWVAAGLLAAGSPVQAASEKARHVAVVKNQAQQKAGQKPKSRSKSKKAAKVPETALPKVQPNSQGVAAATVLSSVISAKNAHGSPKQSPDAELRLLQIITQVGRGNLSEALNAAAQLTEDVPNFQLAQLVYADLLRFRTGHFKEGGAVNAPAGAMLVKHSAPLGSMDAQLQAQLQGLQLELKRRVEAAESQPGVDMVPADVLQLGDSVKHLIAIDEGKSRLYLFTHERGRLRLKASYYVSVGKMGLGKQEEGDMRTPQGMYFVGRHIPGPKLPPFYGKGALTVNYPNDWDKAVGRNGSGIWLHGAPPDQFSRLPRASDGCVVLSNPDLLELMRMVDSQTPVLIRESLQWTQYQDRARLAAASSFRQVLDGWRKASQAGDGRKLSQLYATPTVEKKEVGERVAASLNRHGGGVDDISIYAWKEPGGEVRIVNFQVGEPGKTFGLRQYWQKTAAGWKILSESLLPT